MPPKSPDAPQSVPMYYDSLDWLRAFAALQVLAFHVLSLSNWPQTETVNPLYWFARKGWMGVDLFFVLCGCVITYSLAHLYKSSPEQVSRIFLVRRAARLLPLYYLTLLFCLLFVAYPHHLSALEQLELFVRYLTLTHSIPFADYGFINGPNWSIGVELQFYILMLFLIPFVLRSSYVRIAVTGFAVAWIAKAAVYLYLYTSGKTTLQVIPYFCQLPPLFDAFSCGILLGKFLAQDANRMLPLLWTRRYMLWGITSALLGGVLVAWWSINDAFSFPYFHIPMRSALVVGFSMLVLSLVVLQYGKPAITKGSMRIVGYVGTISYGIYLWHLPVIRLLMDHMTLSPGALLVTTTAITLAVSSLSWHWLEKPCIQFFRRKAT